MGMLIWVTSLRSDFWQAGTEAGLEASVVEGGGVDTD